VLRSIFGPKREEDGSWRKLHNDELHSLEPPIIQPVAQRYTTELSRLLVLTHGIKFNAILGIKYMRQPS